MQKTKKLTFLFLLCSLLGHSQSSEEKFMKFLNNHQADSLETLLSDNFLLKRNYTSYTNDKNNFLQQYVQTSKILNGRFTILKTFNNLTIKMFLVEDQSDLIKYLSIDFPTWLMKVYVKNDKIEKVIIDSTEKTRKYLADIETKTNEFKNWLKEKYPEENMDKLYSTEGLLVIRLKEYRSKK